MTAHERLGGRLRPLGATAAWDAAVLAAGLRCTCTGQCGSRHVKGEGRCPHTLDGGHRLFAAPDPRAGRADGPLPVCCGPCLDAVRRNAALHPAAIPAGTAEDAATPALFALPSIDTATPTTRTATRQAARRTRTRTSNTRTQLRRQPCPQPRSDASPAGGDAA